MDLSIWTKTARKHAGFSQEKLGELLGRTKANVSSWENGRHTPSIAQALLISSLTGYPLPPEIAGKNPPSPSIGTRRIPLISYVQAGSWTEAVDPYAVGSASEYLLTDLDLSSAAFGLEIKGDSMLPEFKEGDRVIIDPAVIPTPGDFVVAKNGDNEATFKKYRPRSTHANGETIFELVPLNDDYPSMRSDERHIAIIGTMMEHRRYRKR